MKSPLISICIPAFKADRYLAETLASVAQQTYPHWELIVVEDGSRDETEKIVHDFAGTVSQSVRFLRHEENRGLPATRNTGIDAALGQWVALLDSDDLWKPGHLASLVSHTGGPHEIDLVHSGSILFQSDTGKFLETRAPSSESVADFPRSLFVADYIIQPASVLMRRKLWEQVGGFDPAFRYVEDRDMWLRCARAGGRFAYTGEETCLYRKHTAALSTHAPEMAEASAAVFEKHLDWEAIPADLRRRLASETWAAAGKLRQRRQPLLARRNFLRACATSWRMDWWLRANACGLLAFFRPASKPVSS